MKTEMLDALNDDELRGVITRAQELLKSHDRERKEHALEQARTLLSSVGLSLKDVAGKSAKRAAAYRGGHHYQHPLKPDLVWNAKGQKPNWLRELERDGGKAIERPEPANDNMAFPVRKTASLNP
ncbi:MAG: H-NS family nucleoid-associated regulatory protein [Terriglobales bacterium]